MAQNNIDEILTKLLSLKDEKPGTHCDLSQDQIIYLCKESRRIFLEQDIVLELRAPLIICGDVHGQFHDLLRLFEAGSFPPMTNYLFLGDYVDRGTQSIEVISLLLAYKIKYPQNFFLLRGNHECSYINRIYGFYEECLAAYNINIWRVFSEVFNCLPIAAIIDDKIFCIHGGLSPELRTVDDIRAIKRPTEIPEKGLLCDLVWSDPNPAPNCEDWGPSERGTSFAFGPAPVEKFLAENDFDLVCRAHQAVMDGYEFPYSGEQSLVTIFSAPNYCGEYGNKGAFLKVNSDLYCVFAVLEPEIQGEDEMIVDKRPGTPPRVSDPTLPTRESLSLA